MVNKWLGVSILLRKCSSPTCTKLTSFLSASLFSIQVEWMMGVARVSRLLRIKSLGSVTPRAKSRVRKSCATAWRNRNLDLHARLLRDQLVHPAMSNHCVG
jgi:hypothetical protein